MTKNINVPEAIQRHIESSEYQARLARDTELTGCIQQGFTPQAPTQENPKPNKVEGELTQDASEALYELYKHYTPIIRKISNSII